MESRVKAPTITATSDRVQSVKGEIACMRYMTCAVVVGAGRPVSPSISVIGNLLSGEQLFGEPELAHVGHALGIQDAIQVVALVLHDAGMEALRLALDRIALLVEAGV